MNYKQDMDAKLFEKFLHETCRLLREKYGDKVALVMDNASYHTVMVRYTYIFGVTRIKPRSAANIHDRHLNVPNINTPWKSAIKRLVLNI